MGDAAGGTRVDRDAKKGGAPMTKDESWMNLALEEARRGVGKTSPNPPVGAVIVKDGMLLGKGWHRKVGLPHAEREAMADARQQYGPDSLVGATAYVTLEPCSTFGRTPPCVAGLIEAGITRVVYACEDPNPAHAGRADVLLQKEGISVVKGVLREPCEKILRPFAKVQRTGLPWVMVKIAMSLDGRITRPKGETSWLSCPASRDDVQSLRAESDAIVTSGETVRQDLPSLTIRQPHLMEGRLPPWRVVISRNPQSLPRNAPLFVDEFHDRTWVSSAEPETILKELAERGVLTVMVEAGGKLVADWMQRGLVDECVIYMTPMITGGLPAMAGEADFPLSLEQAEWKTLGDDVRLRALVRKDHSGK
jgi:diaminohydroxyphosphoribosylaminopyrimidine deaminase/5-amino-6-(5-phosphoribosylamino)uracil reductase